MEVQQQSGRASFLLVIILLGAVFLIAFPVAFDCCKDFRGWLPSAPLFRQMIKNNIVTENQIRSFEILFYLYLVISVISSLSYAMLNNDIAFANASIRGENMNNIAREAVKFFFSLLLLMSLILVPIFVRPELGVKQGLKGWFLIRAAMAGWPFILSCCIMFFYWFVKGRAGNKTKTGGGE